MCPADALGQRAPVHEHMLPELYSVERFTRETADVFTIEVAPRGGDFIAPFRPGQFNMLYAFGIGEVPISIADVKADRIVHTIRAVGTVTRAMAQWKRGAALGLRGPYGSSWPLHLAGGKDLLIIAGGLGLAPLWGALRQALAHRDQFGRLALLYGARTPADLLYRRALDRFTRRQDLHLAVTVDRPGAGWSGNVGVVTELLTRAEFTPANTVAMLCGPEVMMRFTVRELMRRGVAEHDIFLSLERNMKCAIGLCGHCQFGPEFICKGGPVFRHDRIARWLGIPEL
jgi:NAD(P)H-flavin reductase